MACGCGSWSCLVAPRASAQGHLLSRTPRLGLSLCGFPPLSESLFSSTSALPACTIGSAEAPLAAALVHLRLWLQTWCRLGVPAPLPHPPSSWETLPSSCRAQTLLETKPGALKCSPGLSAPRGAAAALHPPSVSAAAVTEHSDPLQGCPGSLCAVESRACRVSVPQRTAAEPPG